MRLCGLASVYVGVRMHTCVCVCAVVTSLCVCMPVVHLPALYTVFGLSCHLLCMQMWAFARTSALENGSPAAPRAPRMLPKSQVLILLSMLCLYTQRELVLVSVG